MSWSPTARRRTPSTRSGTSAARPGADEQRGRRPRHRQELLALERDRALVPRGVGIGAEARVLERRRREATDQLLVDAQELRRRRPPLRSPSRARAPRAPARGRRARAAPPRRPRRPALGARGTRPSSPRRPPRPRPARRPSPGRRPTGDGTPASPTARGSGPRARRRRRRAPSRPRRGKRRARPAAQGATYRTPAPRGARAPGASSRPPPRRDSPPARTACQRGLAGNGPLGRRCEASHVGTPRFR